MDRLQSYRKMHALLKELGIEQAKRPLLEGYGVEHTNDLPDKDLKHLINRLQDMKEEKLKSLNDQKKHWMSNVLAVLNKYGIYVTNNDWTEVNRLLLDKRISGKLLYEMDKEELQKTAIRLHAVLSKRQKIQEEEKELAQQN